MSDDSDAFGVADIQDALSGPDADDVQDALGPEPLDVLVFFTPPGVDPGGARGGLRGRRGTDQ